MFINYLYLEYTNFHRDNTCPHQKFFQNRRKHKKEKKRLEIYPPNIDFFPKYYSKTIFVSIKAQQRNLQLERLKAFLRKIIF